MNKRRQGGFAQFLIALSLVAAAALSMLMPLSMDAMAETAKPEMPFSPGERLRFQLRWAMVPAGEAVLEVLPVKTIAGHAVYHFRLTAESNAFVDLFYKVRDRIEAFAATDMTHAVRYHHKQREGRRRKDVKVNFIREKGVALYNDGQKNNEIEIQPGTFDPLSVFYFSRMAEFKTDGLIECPVSDGKKCVVGQARIIRKETIDIISGTYETFLIEPDLKHVGGVFEKSKDAKIQLWVTADDKHIPVKIASKVAIGSFIGELMAVENSDPQNNS